MPVLHRWRIPLMCSPHRWPPWGSPGYRWSRSWYSPRCQSRPASYRQRTLEENVKLPLIVCGMTWHLMYALIVCCTSWHLNISTCVASYPSYLVVYGEWVNLVTVSTCHLVLWASLLCRQPYIVVSLLMTNVLIVSRFGWTPWTWMKISINT